jgi:acyl carrier protein
MAAEKGDADKGGVTPAEGVGGNSRIGAVRAAGPLSHAPIVAPTPQVSPDGNTPARCSRCAIKAKVREFLMREWLLNDVATVKDAVRIREDLGFNYAANCLLAGDLQTHFGIEIPPRAEFSWKTVGDLLATVVPLIEAKAA